MGTHYLIDHEYRFDNETLFATIGHLLVYNPGERDSEVAVTVYYEDREPKSFALATPARQSVETNYTRWPVQPGQRFALKVESPVPVVCQSTNGWNATANDYGLKAVTNSPRGVRECALSYMAITALSTDWYTADGLVIDRPTSVYIRESEWAFILNPGDEPANVTLNFDTAEPRQYPVIVPPRRVTNLYIDDIVQRNKHYGVHFGSDRPIAAQWRRHVNWNDNPELMAFWSAPCVPGPLT